MVRPGDKRELVTYVSTSHGMSIRRACHVFGLSKTDYGYQPRLSNNGLIIETLVSLAEQFPQYSFGKLFPLIRWQHPIWNHKRVYRVYCALRLYLRRTGKKLLPAWNPVKLAVPVAANVCWSVDCMSDVLTSGQRLWAFNVLDELSREVLAIEVDTTLPAARVIRVLDRITAWRGCPARHRMDNGSGFASVTLTIGRKTTAVEL